MMWAHIVLYSVGDVILAQIQKLSFISETNYLPVTLQVKKDAKLLAFSTPVELHVVAAHK